MKLDDGKLLLEEVKKNLKTRGFLFSSQYVEVRPGVNLGTLLCCGGEGQGRCSLRRGDRALPRLLPGL